MIKAGEIAPNFVVKDSDNKEISLKNLRGKFVLLLFYPRDNSHVCTKQMCEYRDNWQVIRQLGIEVLAVNPASAEKHKSFKKDNNLPFPVLSDENSLVAEKYGAKNLFGMTKRAYVLISPEGNILFSQSEVVGLLFTTSENLAAIIREKITNYKTP